MKEPLFFRRFNYNKSLLPNSHLASLETGVTSISEAEKRSGWSIGHPGWGLIYHLLLCQLKPESENIILETGTNQGATTIVLAQALMDSGYPGHVHTIEIERKFIEKAVNNLEKANVSENVTIHQGASQEVLGSLLPKLPRVRAVFLDASHLFMDVMTEFALIEPFLCKGAIVIMDNTFNLSTPGEDIRVHGALPAIVKKWGGKFINLEYVSWYTPGLAIWQREPFPLSDNKQI